MALTINEALELPVMAEASLLAGRSGLENEIKWVTIVEIIEDITRLQDGEFLITTGYKLLENKIASERFKALLSMGKLSGVAIYYGVYLQEIPQDFLTIADQHSLPIIQIPAHINFSSITKEILQAIINRQQRLLEHSITIHRELTDLVLRDVGIDRIIETISGLINGDICLLNDLQQIDYSNNSNAIEFHEAERDLTLNGVKVIGIPSLIQLLDHDHSVTIENNGYTLYGCKIAANDQLFGYLVGIKTSMYKTKKFDLVAIEHGATILAIEFLKEAAVLKSNLRLQGDFFGELLDKAFTREASAVKYAAKFGYDLTLPQTVIVIKPFYHANEATYHFIEDYFLRMYDTFDLTVTDFNGQCLIKKRIDSIVMLVHFTANESSQFISQLKSFAEKLHSRLSSQFHEIELTIGIGKTVNGIAGIEESLKEAENAVRFAGLVPATQSIIHYNDLGMYHLLIDSVDKGVSLARYYEEIVSPLITKNAKDINLIKTAEAYLRNNLNLQTTSKELFIHRHTLKYRLNQIERKTGLSLLKADDRMKLQLAIMAYNLDRIKMAEK